MRHAVFTTCCFCCTDGTQTSMPTVYFNKVRLSLIVLTLSASAERLPLFAYESFFWKPSPHEWTPLLTGDSSSTRRYRCTLCVGVSEPRFVVFFNMPSLNPAPSTWMSQVKFTGQALCTARKQEASSVDFKELLFTAFKSKWKYMWPVIKCQQEIKQDLFKAISIIFHTCMYCFQVSMWAFSWKIPPY